MPPAGALRLRDDRRSGTKAVGGWGRSRIFPSTTSQASPTSRLLRIKAVCDRWHPMAEERLPVDVHAKTALTLRLRDVAPPGWDEADGKIRKDRWCLRHRSNNLSAS